MARRRTFEGQEWAEQDYRWMVLFFVLVALGVTVQPVFLWLALAVLGYGGGRLVVEAVRRRRRERLGDRQPFWADRIRD